MAKKSKPTRRPAPKAAVAPEIPEELQAVVNPILELARQSPDGWGTIAEVFKQQPEANADEVLPLLARALGKEVLPLLRGLALEPDEALALPALRSLPLLGTRAAGEALAEAYGQFKDGERGRLAWEGVRALQALGIAVRVEGPENTPTEPTHRLRETWETFPDGVGSRTVYARMQDRYGVWQTTGLIWNDRAGVKDSFRAPISRQEWDEMKLYSAREGVVLAPVPPDYSRAQVAHAITLNEQSGLALGTHVEVWNELVGPPTAEYQSPDPLAEVAALSADEREALLDDSDLLLARPEFQSWGVEPADVQPWFEAWTKLDADLDEETLDEEAYAEQAEKLLAELANKIIDTTWVTLFRDRLAESALKLQWTGELQSAKLAAAVAVALGEGAEPGSLVFFRGLGDRSLEMLSDMVTEGEDPEKWRFDPLAPIENEPAPDPGHTHCADPTHQHTHNHESGSSPRRSQRTGQHHHQRAK